MSSTPWPRAKEAELLRLAQIRPALSASQIGERFDPPLTRNSIIGKLMRMGVGLGNAAGPAPPPKKPRQSRAKVRLVAPPVRIHRPVPMMLLDPHTCRFPINAAGEPRLFCGDEPSAGRVYCQRHVAICFQPRGRVEREEAA